MGQYYRGAAVSICAVAASHCEQGILRPRPDTLRHPKLDRIEGLFYLRLLLPDSVSVTDAVTYTDIRNLIPTQPWNSRAWTLQERLFSRRAIYFTEEQMIRRCQTRFFSEDSQYTRITRPYGNRFIDRSIVDLAKPRPRIVGKDETLDMHGPDHAMVQTSTEVHATISSFQ